MKENLKRLEKNEKYKFVLDHYEELNKKSLIAWDYCRMVFVANQSYIAGYLTYDEAVNEIMNAAKVVQSTYFSWDDMGRNYMLGSEFWTGNKYYDDIRTNALNWLMKSPYSPWKLYDWNLQLYEKAGTDIQR